MPELKHWITITITGSAILAPQYIAALPQHYQMLGSALFGVLGAFYHLYQPSPNN